MQQRLTYGKAISVRTRGWFKLNLKVSNGSLSHQPQASRDRDRPAITTYQATTSLWPLVCRACPDAKIPDGSIASRESRHSKESESAVSGRHSTPPIISCGTNRPKTLELGTGRPCSPGMELNWSDDRFPKHACTSHYTKLCTVL
jgi:hypothetical protein